MMASKIRKTEEVAVYTLDMIRILFFLFLTLQIFLTAEQPILIFMGTRPEAIKLLPLQLALQKENILTLLCSTGQHNELIKPIFDLFKVEPDFDFAIMKTDQDLFYITESVLQKAKALINEVKPQLVIVQGDTTSGMAAALAAFYLRVPVAHVEAGLRTYNIDRPFPEEMNRRVIALIASYHFAPTAQAVSHLINEGIKKESIFLTGNTVVDALLMIKDRIAKKELAPSEELVALIEKQKSLNRKLMLLTMHRREAIADKSIVEVFQAVKQALTENPNLFAIFPVHPNPQIRKCLEQAGLDRMGNLSIMPPLPYLEMVYLLNEVDFIATDSGGIQEEAVSLNKPVLVLRNETDRPEGLKGSATLVGTETSKILQRIQTILRNEPPLEDKEVFIYGDGQSCKRITKIIKEALDK